MDLMREEFLQQMLKNGRAYPHEVRSIAEELLRRRAGEDVKEKQDVTSDVLRIEITGLELANAVYVLPSSGAIGRLKQGERIFVKFRPGTTEYHCLMYRIK
jgi:hypothetical protein